MARHCVNETITLDSSTDTDIIECSREDMSTENVFFKTPRSLLKRKCTSATKNKVISLKGFQLKSGNQLVKSPANDKMNDSLICKLQTSCKLNESGASVIPSTPEKKENSAGASQSAMNKQNTPDLPYLSRAKANRIEKWLNDNDVENVKILPSSTGRRRATPRKTVTATSRKRLAQTYENSSDSSSIDSEVKRILEVVYGSDWRDKNILKKSRTEPKRRRGRIPSTKTDIKTKPREAKSKPVKTVRRNIMAADILGQACGKPENLENSFSLGVDNLNESTDSLGMINMRWQGKTSASSSDSWRPPKTKSENIKASQGRTAEPTEKTPMKTFLASLSVSTPKRRCHPEAQNFKINFKTKKEELARKLFKLYNAEVFGNGLPDDMNISWNIKLRGTAGYCYNKKIIKTTGQIIRLSRIEFSTKIIDRADRLRDTMIHELCHAASWVIDGMLDGHGSIWSKWARKAMERFPELPPIERCHNYEIVAKYTYKCTGCGYSINRHSKSIDTDRKRCGYCFGILELFVNKKKRGKGEVPEFNSTRTLPAPNNFALFVKENYQNAKGMHKNAKHAEIMKILSEKYAMTKVTG